MGESGIEPGLTEWNSHANHCTTNTHLDTRGFDGQPGQTVPTESIAIATSLYLCLMSYLMCATTCLMM